MTVRLRLDVRYDGAAFHGWAVQGDLRTVQGELETWIPRLLRLPGRVSLVCAGRTDAGVHARGQVAHLDLPLDDGEEAVATLTRRLRRVLPPDVVVTGVRVAPEGFDARFSAVWRRYVYRLTDGAPDPLTRSTVVALRRPLDVALVNRAAARLLGLHNFAAFCRERKGATTIRQLRQLEAVRAHEGPGLVEVTVLADAFCHSMVRSLMGGLVAVGTGRQDEDWLADLLSLGSRAGDITVMPPQGLVLEEVGYPPDDQLAARARESRATRTLPLEAP